MLSLLLIVQVVENSVLGSAKEEALARIRDKDDWPALALALQYRAADRAAVAGAVGKNLFAALLAEEIEALAA